MKHKQPPTPTPLQPRWYCVDKNGLATLCRSESDAIAAIAEYARDWPLNAPYQAALLGDVRAVKTWADKHSWACDSWKSEPYNAALFEMAKAICAIECDGHSHA